MRLNKMLDGQKHRYVDRKNSDMNNDKIMDR